MWGRDVIRIHCVPYNPKSANQQLNRFRFRFISRVGVGASNFVVHPFWDVLNKFGIGFNTFVKINMMSVSSENDFENINITFGNYPPVENIVFSKYKDLNGRLMVKWDPTIPVGASADDRVLITLLDCSCYDAEQGIYEIMCLTSFDKLRSDSVGFILPGKDLNIDNMHSYVSCVRQGSINKNTISISKYKKVIGV